MNYLRIIIGGVAATAVMTLLMLAAPMIHLPVVDAGALLGARFHNNLLAGWGLHFAIGIFFAWLYALAFNEFLPVINNFFRGALYGIIVFVFSETVFTVINLGGYFSDDMKQLMAKAVFTNMFACLTYGFVLGGIVKQFHFETFDWEQKEYFWRFRKAKKV